MPSATILEQKKQVVSDLSEQLKAAAAGVLVDYRGLTVEEDNQLRAKFREAGVSYKVVKNNLLRFAAKEVGLGELDDVLHGPTALAIHNDDLVAPAKVMAEFAKKHEIVSIKAGFMEGHIISLDEVKTLAATPSREVLLAKMMGSMMSPANALARLLNAIVEKGVEPADLAAGVTTPAEAAPAVEEAAPVAEAVAEEAPAAQEAAAEESEAPAGEPVEEAAPAEETPAE